ncbi:hypothetical protein [Pseudomonas sp. MYb185]|uniref:hypothetical protein n=1 Tax=Pseudomonas sp. MYb185 TaxID=1848729 RepID=UPI000CFC7989|nr:hypothetical protein [Pseudomonas sp. MYb185]PRB82120.1 hypothetical protein CQ007_08145 [Pseudomonas sp. MYb185]
MQPLRLTLLTLLCLLSNGAWADILLVIKPRETELTRAFVDALQHQRPADTLLIQLLGEPPNPGGATIITMGPEALDWRLQQTYVIPTIATYITLDQLGPHPSSDQPPFVQILLASAKPERQLSLAQLLIPRLHSAGLLYSSEQRWQLPLWEAAAQRRGLTLHARSVATQQDLLRRLASVLNASEVLIGLDDPQVYNANNLKPLLLGSYTRNRVLIGPSAPFIAAGSLSTTYSSAQDMADSVHAMLQDDWHPGAVRYPERFSVLSNPQVAHSLGLPPPQDAELQQRIHAEEQASP